MTAPTPSSTAQAAKALSDHLSEYAQFLEVKEKVHRKLEELQQSERILHYTVQERRDAVLLVLMFIPVDLPREVEYGLMSELRDFSGETGVLVDAFVRTVDDSLQSAQDDL